jgi:hypothetical protein
VERDALTRIAFPQYLRRRLRSAGGEFKKQAVPMNKMASNYQLLGCTRSETDPHFSKGFVFAEG